MHLSTRDLLRLVRYSIRNKFPFTLTYILAKLHESNKVYFENDSAVETLNSLCKIANRFYQELTFLLSIIDRCGYRMIKIPYMPLDLTLDLDVVDLEGVRHREVLLTNSSFGIRLDIYSKYSIYNQYGTRLNNNVSKPRYLKLIRLEGSKAEIANIRVPSIDIITDAKLILKNILSNRFITYYDYLNITLLRKQTAASNEEKCDTKMLPFRTIPISLLRGQYPKMIIEDIGELSFALVLKFIKALINTSYTPVYGNLIKHFKAIAYKLGEFELASII